MYNKPIFFERNRVFRVYQGGKLFADFFGDTPEDGNFPEEWVASCVTALNKESAFEKEGVSKLLGSGLHFDELLAKYPKEMLGKAGSFGILVKLLDSAIRLPVQAHPDRAFSRKYFGSPFGKAESWIVLATREGAKIYYGFREGITKEKFLRAIDESRTNPSAMAQLLCEYPVVAGDVFFIPAKTVHAIGEGCLILEVQEPTDFTISPEHFCGDYALSEQEMFLGLHRDIAMDCFDFSVSPKPWKTPKTIMEQAGYRYEELIGMEDTPCFCVNKISLSKGSFTLFHAPAVYVVTGGSGSLIGKGYEKKLQKGSYFFLPYCVNQQFSLESNHMEVAECFS